MRRYRFGQLEFSWDERKAVQNARRHGVRFEDTATAFADPLARVYARRPTPRERAEYEADA